jgi:ATP-dependent DNA helicase RecQ
VTVALTATAAQPVRDEIVERLRLHEPFVVVAGFNRPNLHLAVHPASDGEARREFVLRQAAELSGCGIVYTATRRETEEYATALTDRGRRAAAYHAGLRKVERGATHDAFRARTLDVVVATTPFGLGIDKPDIRFVIHAALADSLDSSYQELLTARTSPGRAVRPPQPAATRRRLSHSCRRSRRKVC